MFLWDFLRRMRLFPTGLAISALCFCSSVLANETAERKFAQFVPEVSDAPKERLGAATRQFDANDRKETRVALVVGVGNYRNTTALENPGRDAVSVAAMLRALDFEVIQKTDINQSGFGAALLEFGSKLEGADVALFYFAGHGMQINGHNYLLSANAKVDNPHLVSSDGMRLDRILALMERSAETTIAFVDACRDNPLANTLRKKSGQAGRSLGLTRGLAKLAQPFSNSLVTFATAPGMVALDGEERNSPFTAALLKHLSTPGVEISTVLKRVTGEVLNATNGQQRPEVVASMAREFYFVEANVNISGTVTIDDPARTEKSAMDLLKVARAMGSSSQRKVALELVQNQYPETGAAKMAGLLIVEIDNKEKSASAAKTSQRPQAVKAKPFDRSQLARLDPDAAAHASEAVRVNQQTPAEVEDELGLEQTDYKRIQLALNTLGYDVGVEDGSFGPKSRSGLKKFQVRNGVENTGFFTNKTLNTLLTSFENTPKNYDGEWEIEFHRHNYEKFKGKDDWNSRALLMKARLRFLNNTVTIISSDVYSSRKPLFDTFDAKLSSDGLLSIETIVDYIFYNGTGRTKSKEKRVRFKAKLPRFVPIDRTLEFKGPLLERERGQDPVWAKIELRRRNI